MDPVDEGRKREPQTEFGKAKYAILPRRTLCCRSAERAAVHAGQRPRRSARRPSCCPTRASSRCAREADACRHTNRRAQAQGLLPAGGQAGRAARPCQDRQGVASLGDPSGRDCAAPHSLGGSLPAPWAQAGEHRRLAGVPESESSAWDGPLSHPGTALASCKHQQQRHKQLLCCAAPAQVTPATCLSKVQSYVCSWQGDSGCQQGSMMTADHSAAARSTRAACICWMVTK